MSDDREAAMREQLARHLAWLYGMDHMTPLSLEQAGTLAHRGQDHLDALEAAGVIERSGDWRYDDEQQASIWDLTCGDYRLVTPGPPDPPQPINGIVTDVGGGQMTVTVDGDTVRYPNAGTRGSWCPQ